VVIFDDQTLALKDSCCKIFRNSITEYLAAPLAVPTVPATTLAGNQALKALLGKIIYKWWTFQLHVLFSWSFLTRNTWGSAVTGDLSPLDPSLHKPWV